MLLNDIEFYRQSSFDAVFKEKFGLNQLYTSFMLILTSAGVVIAAAYSLNGESS